MKKMFSLMMLFGLLAMACTPTPDGGGEEPEPTVNPYE